MKTFRPLSSRLLQFSEEHLDNEDSLHVNTKQEECVIVCRGEMLLRPLAINGGVSFA